MPVREFNLIAYTSRGSFRSQLHLDRGKSVCFLVLHDCQRVLGSTRRCVCVLRYKCRDWCEGRDVSGLIEHLEALFNLLSSQTTPHGFRN